MPFYVVFLLIILTVNALDKKCCFCIPPLSRDYCVVEGTRGGLRKKAALTLRNRKSLIPDDMDSCDNLCHPFDTMKVNRLRKVPMTCDAYIKLHKRVKMCHEWHEWDEFEGDEHFSLKGDNDSFERSDKDSFEGDADSFHSAIGSEDDHSMSSLDSFYSVYSDIDGDSESEISLRKSLIPILPIGMFSLSLPLSLNFLQRDALILFSNTQGARRCNEERAIGCYDEVDASRFNVRGPDYMTSKRKIHPKKSLFDLVSVDLLRQEAFLTSEGSYDENKFENMVTTLINTRLGKNVAERNANGIVLHFFITKRNNLEGWHAFIFFTRNVDAHDESFETQFTAFLDQSDEYRRERFKLLVAEFETLDSAGWGTRMTAAGVRALVPPAVILGRDPKLDIVYRKIEPNEFHGSVLRSDINLSRSGMVERVKGILTSLKISLGLTFECKEDHVDCPERLLGSFSFVGANIEVSLDSSSGDLDDVMRE